MCEFGGHHRKLCNKQCIYCFNRSFASHFKAQFWHPEWNEFIPREVVLSSKRKGWFICNSKGCEHIFECSIFHITNKKIPIWCPYCAIPSKKVCSDECNNCFNRSFASHPKAKFWHPEWNKLTPREITIRSGKKGWFICQSKKCGHTFESNIYCITRLKNQTWCPYCAGKKLCSSNECDSCFKHSFASHPRAEFWHSEWNKLTPREVIIGSRQKGWFICNKCSSTFESTMCHIKIGHWCPYCKNKTELLFYQWLIDNGFAPKRQLRFKWCRNPATDRYLPFDFLVGNTIIELDGLQHFKQISNWQSPEVIQSRDAYKERTAICNGYHIVRLLQEDVWNTLGNLNMHIHQLDNWQTIFLDLLSKTSTTHSVTLISNDALWPGFEGHHIIEITNEPRLIFFLKKKT